MHKRDGLSLAVVTVAFCLSVGFAQADPPPIYNSFASGEAVHDRGSVRGRVADIDYGSGTMVVRNGHETMTIAVLPSTQITIGGQYATLADIKRGAEVDCSISEVGGRLVAQVIRLR